MAEAEASTKPATTRDDGREGDGRDEGEHEVAEEGVLSAAQELREQGGRHVAARVDRGDVGRTDELGSAKAQEQRQHIEAADDGHGPDHRFARRLRGRHGEEAHQDVRQAGGAEHQRHAQRDLVDRRLEVQTRFEEALAELVGRHVLGRVAEQGSHARLHLRVADHIGQEGRQREAVGRPHQHHEHDGRDDEQDGLDDLHPGGGDHAAEQHIGQHQHAHGDDRDFIVDADQGLDQHTAADHLRGQVEGGHGDDRDGADDAGLLRVVAVGQDVGQGVLADVAARLGDDEQHGDVSHQPAHRIHEAVVTVLADEARDAEEGRGRKIVTRDGPAVLQARDAAARGVEVGGRLHTLGREVGDEHRQADDGGEHREGEPAVVGRHARLRKRGRADQRNRADHAPGEPFLGDRVHGSGLRFLFEFRGEFARHGVEFTVGATRVIERDAPGDDEFGQGEHEADIDRAPDLDLEKILEVRGADRQQKVIDDRKDHQAPQKALLLAMESLESGIGDDRIPVDGGGGCHGCSPVRCIGGAVLCARCIFDRDAYPALTGGLLQAYTARRRGTAI